jgi:hypothetical protein
LGEYVYEGDMILGGIWYKCMVGPSTQNPSYMLLKGVHLVVTYFHLFIKSKFAMFFYATRKGNPSLVCLHTSGRTYLVLLKISKHIVPIDVLDSKANAKILVD